MPPLDVLIPVAGLALLDTLSPTTLGVSLFVLLGGARSSSTWAPSPCSTSPWAAPSCSDSARSCPAWPA